MTPAELFDMRGRTALVTGGGAGLGRQFSLTLAAAGATVVLAARRLAPLEEVAEAIRHQGGVAHCLLLVPANLRAFTSAVLALVVGIVGLGLGPLITGMLSDLFATRYGLGQDSLRYAIAASAIPSLWGAVHFMRAAHYLRDELANASRVAHHGDIATDLI